MCKHNDRPLHDKTEEVLQARFPAWGFDVHLESVNSKGESVAASGRCPPRRPEAALGPIVFQQIGASGRELHRDGSVSGCNVRRWTKRGGSMLRLAMPCDGRARGWLDTGDRQRRLREGRHDDPRTALPAGAAARSRLRPAGARRDGNGNGFRGRTGGLRRAGTRRCSRRRRTPASPSRTPPSSPPRCCRRRWPRPRRSR